MKDAQGDPAYGRTNWRRFAVAVGVPTVVAGGLVFGLANGAFAASLTVSGQAFKIKADTLVGDGFAQYSDLHTTVNGQPIPVAVSGIKHATLYNLCQSVHPNGSPVSRSETSHSTSIERATPRRRRSGRTTGGPLLTQRGA